MNSPETEPAPQVDYRTLGYALERIRESNVGDQAVRLGCSLPNLPGTKLI